ncbi:hypothetical protein [Herbidospora sp. NBRC 101105]|uniref:hypothetical protein n=1 Tax=Herbidospora sp. NBRC 101105 TaxID=3032195 RepID=UPI0024A2016B|nr:hypothetical protein [Herbidospora sp. NBRC 101105]GLX96770.1 hypothetical protein Hesp01_47200 [Herbidospora sp. NBRC 101105]
MAELAYTLDDLTCASCGTTDSLWIYPVRALVECRECGTKAAMIPDQADEFEGER